jgi:hypothetical protein
MRKGKRLSHDVWRGLIEEQGAGEETIAAFCRERGLKEHSFYRHKRRMRESGVAAGFREIPLAARGAIRVVVNAETSHVEVECGFDAALLREVVQALR